ncbi:MAG: hypothetical protein U0X93_07535 [Anaerolineales bacterium]
MRGGGVLGVLLSTVGTLQATEAIKISTGHRRTSHWQITSVQRARYVFRFCEVEKELNRRVCGPTPTSKS